MSLNGSKGFVDIILGWFSVAQPFHNLFTRAGLLSIKDCIYNIPCKCNEKNIKEKPATPLKVRLEEYWKSYSKGR